jgi:gliding motility-associated-like protein
MRGIYLLALALLLSHSLYAQCSNTFRLLLHANGDELPMDIRQLPGGDIIIGGETTSAGAGGRDLFLTRMTQDGQIVWNKTYGGNSDEFFRRLRLSKDGNILVVAATESNGKSRGDAIVMKVDPDGNMFWTVNLTPSQAAYSLDVDVYGASDNSTIASGAFYDASGSSTCMIAKIDDATGHLLWTRTLDYASEEDIYTVIQKRDTLFFVGDMLQGNYTSTTVKMSLATGKVYETNAYIADSRGAFGGKIDYSSNQYRLNLHIIDGANYANMQQAMVIMDTAFNPLKSFKILASPLDNYYYTGFFQSADGGFITTGSPNDNSGGFLYKFDKTGTLVYTRKFTGNSLTVTAAIEASDGAIWLIGSENSDVAVMKLDGNGNFQNCTNQPVTRTTSPITFNKAPSFNWSDTSGYNPGPAFTPAIANFTFSVTATCAPAFCGDVQLKGRDTICNLADTVTYIAATSGTCTPNFQWTLPTGIYSQIVNDSTVKVVYPASGLYNIIVTNMGGCNVKSDTVVAHVLLSPRSVSLGRDSLFCNPGSMSLDAGAGFARYQWQDGSSGQHYLVNKGGSYFVLAYNACNEYFSDTMQVTYRLPGTAIATPVDTAYCVALAPIQFSANGGDTYVWSPATYLDDAQTSDPVGKPDASIKYTVTVKDTLCNRTNTVNVNVRVVPPPLVGLTKTNDVNCSAGVAELIATGGDRYEWTPDPTLSGISIANPLVRPEKTTTYVVTAYNSLNCGTQDSITVNFEKTGIANIYMPNAFSPNGDGKNDVFRVVSAGSVTMEVFNVYNRLGELVFSTKDISKGWDGNINGQPADVGSYYWYVSASSPCTDNLFKKGYVILVR